MSEGGPGIFSRTGGGGPGLPAEGSGEARGCSDGRPVGVFDSGVGGLTVLKQLLLRLPGERMLYLGDTARLPYGTKSRETVEKYSLQNASFLVEKGIKCLVVACNTASSLALETLRRSLPIPVLGVIEPGARRAAQLTRTGKIGVIGTVATVRSGAYERAILSFANNVKVFSVPCPLFVPLAEEGWIDEDVTYQVARRYLGPLLEKGVDVLVLGCTHYPLLKTVIGGVMGSGVVLVDSAEEVAAMARDLLHEKGLMSTNSREAVRPVFYMTDHSPHFVDLASKILGVPVTKVEHVDI
jgi:glutamate racemase